MALYHISDKGYRTIKAAIVIGALTAAAVPYVNNTFYAGILDRLVLAEYDTAVIYVLWMVSAALVLKLAAKGCERIVAHYCKPCADEIKKRTARKAFTMEYEMIDRTETLEAFRRVRAGEIGMGGVERQLQTIFDFFRELAGIVFACGFVLVLFARTDSDKENMAVSVFLAALMIAAFAVVFVLSDHFSKKEGEVMVETALKNEHVNTLSAYLLNLINKETYVKDIRLFGLKDYLYKKTEVFRTVGRMYTEQGCYSGRCRAVPTFAAQMFAAVTYICIAAKAIAEAEIYENFNALIRNKTAVYISHRMSSCKFRDRIVVLGDGRILEEGNHETLLAQKGTYYRLYSAQEAYYGHS